MFRVYNFFLQNFKNTMHTQNLWKQKEFWHVEHKRSKKKTTTSFIFFKSVNEIKIRGKKKKKKKKNQVDAIRGKLMVQLRRNQQKEGGRKRVENKGEKGEEENKKIKK